MSATFPSCPNKRELHIKIVCSHYILCRHTFSTDKWHLIFLRNRSTNMCAVYCTNAILHNTTKHNINQHVINNE
uniref:Uncharacterized protein n=1 Tax=Populus trichocarpa TaxID=3694 RepID=A0A2K1R9L5_POPTR